MEPRQHRFASRLGYPLRRSDIDGTDELEVKIGDVGFLLQEDNEDHVKFIRRRESLKTYERNVFPTPADLFQSDTRPLKMRKLTFSDDPQDPTVWI